MGGPKAFVGRSRSADTGRWLPSILVRRLERLELAVR